MHGQAKPDTKTDRRAFLFMLGGAAAVISGWVAVRKDTESPKSRSGVPNGTPGPAFAPRLASGLVTRRTNGGAEILSGEVMLAIVNAQGRMVIERMDGRRSIAELSQSIADPSHVEQAESAVVAFLAELASAGLLAERFYANVYAVEVRA